MNLPSPATILKLVAPFIWSFNLEVVSENESPRYEELKNEFKRRYEVKSDKENTEILYIMESCNFLA